MSVESRAAHASWCGSSARPWRRTATCAARPRRISSGPQATPARHHFGPQGGDDQLRRRLSVERRNRDGGARHHRTRGGPAAARPRGSSRTEPSCSSWPIGRFWEPPGRRARSGPFRSWAERRGRSVRSSPTTPAGLRTAGRSSTRSGPTCSSRTPLARARARSGRRRATSRTPVFAPDGRRLRVSVVDPKDGRPSLWDVGADGSDARPLLPGFEGFTCCGRWSPDGRHYGRVRPLGGIDAEGVSFSHDGQWVAWVMPDGGLWRSRADGTEKLQLSFPPLWAALPEWSPDGKRLCFARLQRGAPTTLMFVSARGGPAQEALPGDKGSQLGRTGRRMAVDWPSGATQRAARRTARSRSRSRTSRPARSPWCRARRASSVPAGHPTGDTSRRYLQTRFACFSTISRRSTGGRSSRDRTPGLPGLGA